MPRLEQHIKDFDVYENGVRYYGRASATLPDLSSLTTTISGSGIAGNIDAPVTGHFDAMTLALDFRLTTGDALTLFQQRAHHIELRVANELQDTVTHEFIDQAVKHVFVVHPKKYSGGKVAPSSTADASGEFSVHYWATYVDGKKMLEIDQLNSICIVDGVDYLAGSNSILGRG
jgi:P2 family phage contractile tail tube protein